jgi:hypothetical protein
MKTNVTDPIVGRDYRVEVRPYPGGSTYEGIAKFKYTDAQGTWVLDWTGSDVFYDPLRPDKFSCVAVAEIQEGHGGVRLVPAPTFTLTLPLAPCSEREINCMFCHDPRPAWESTYRARGSQRVTVGLCEACRTGVTPLQKTTP